MSGAMLYEGYGLTEASPTTHSTPTLAKRKIGSIGLPFPSTECKIVDLETGERIVPIGETGELCVRGPQVMKGYWNRPEETAIALRDGWLYTGDVARMDEDGYFYIVQRKKDMIIVSGFNVYPNEVEDVLFTHPAVLEAAVIGVPDPYRGEAVKAFITLRPGVAATPDEVIEFCRANLAKYKVPSLIEFMTSLPKSAVGKVLRRELREMESQKQK
jgi:long-chain acyl-CoA synthetase